MPGPPVQPPPPLRRSPILFLSRCPDRISVGQRELVGGYAMSKDYKDAPHMQKLTDLDPLRHREDIQILHVYRKDTKLSTS